MTIVPYRADRVPRADRLAETIELVDRIGGTDFVPQSLRNNSPAILAAILYGDEIGLEPMQSLSKIAVINGRPTLAAETQRAKILAEGHDLWIEESTNTRCVIAGRRRNSDAVSRVTWTMDDAKRAKLSGKPPWQMYPRAMLLARASAELARAVFPDAIGGLAATEELDEEGLIIGAAGMNGQVETPPAATTTRRRRASVTAGAATTPPAPAATSGAEPGPSQATAGAGLGEQAPAPSAPALPEAEQALVDQLEQDLAAEPADKTPPSISEPQRRKLHALLREKGVQDRDDKIAYCAGVIAHKIGSSNDLTLEEAGRIIDHLEQYDPDNPQTWPFPDGF